MTAVYDDDKGVRKQEITKLENCSVLDSKNWTCGGVWSGNSKSPRYMFVGGDLAYEKAFYSFVTNCDSKFIRR